MSDLDMQQLVKRAIYRAWLHGVTLTPQVARDVVAGVLDLVVRELEERTAREDLGPDPEEET